MILSASRMRSLLSALAHDQLDGGAAEAEGLAQAIFQIALVRKVEQGRTVAEDHEGGGPHADLGHVVDLQGKNKYSTVPKIVA